MTRAANPTARALRALEVLQSRPGITATDLGAALGVTERAARRYVTTLREAGIAVESDRGPYGGYRLGRGLRLPPLVFTATEALGLVMAVLDGNHAAADPDDPVGSGLGKIIRALPTAVGESAARMRAHASAAPDRGRSRPDPATTSDLVAAVADRATVTVTYRSEAGREWAAAVDPWAVVVRHGYWYLLCFSHPAQAVRTYRVDRVASVAPTGDHFPPPEIDDPVDTLEGHLGSGWEFETRVVFEHPIAEVRAWVRRPMGRLSELGAAETLLAGTTSNPRMYAGEWLAGIPLRFRVQGGPQLRAAVADLGAALTASVAAAEA